MEYHEKNIIPFRRYRSCTDNFKIKPIHKKIKEIFPQKDRQVIMFLGITTDEIQRVKPSKVKWITNVFPLVDLNLSRQDLFAIYKQWELDPPVKSGCFCCPFQKKTEWFNLQRNHPELIQLSIELEHNAMKNRSNTNISLYTQNMTLKELMENYEDKQVMEELLFGDDMECEGACFL